MHARFEAEGKGGSNLDTRGALFQSGSQAARAAIGTGQPKGQAQRPDLV